MLSLRYRNVFIISVVIGFLVGFTGYLISTPNDKEQ